MATKTKSTTPAPARRPTSPEFDRAGSRQRVAVKRAARVAAMQNGTDPDGAARAAMPAPEAPRGGLELLQRAVCLSVTMSRLGTRRRLSTDAVEVEADKDMIRVAKIILESDALQAIRRLDNDARRYIYQKALPATFFRHGVYLLGLGLVAEVDATLTAFVAQRRPLVAAFVAAYPRLQEDARQRLGPHFNPDEYPSPDVVERFFDFRWSYIAFGVPDAQLARISGALASRAAQEFERSMADAFEDVQTALRVAMSEVVDEMVDKMTDRANGKPQVFRDSSLARVKEFLDTFRARNLTEDGALAALVERARLLMTGVDPETIRERADVRRTVQAGFAAIKAAIAPMLTAKPRRAIGFEE
jgi:hypothetical protein